MSTTEPLPDSPHERDAAGLAFDLTRQFIAIALGGIGFIVGLHYASPSTISTLMFWATLTVFGVSAVFGLVFLMHGVSRLYNDKSYDVYATGLRITSIMQILLVLLGVTLLCLFLGSPSTQDKDSIQIRIGENLITYPHDPDRNYTIKIENDRVEFSATKPQ